MSSRWTSWLAASLWTVSMMLTSVTLVLMHANGEIVGSPLGSALFLAASSSLATVGALLAVHRPGNPIGWIFVTTALSVNISVMASAYGKYITETAPGALPAITLLFWLGAWTYLVVFMLPPIFGVLLFPTGRLPSRRWRPFAWFAGIWIALLITIEMLSPGPLDPEPDGAFSQFANPIGVEALTGVFDFLLMVDEKVPIGIIPFVGAIASIFVRLRGATTIERQQIKWFAYAATIPIVGLLVEELIYAFSDTATEGEETAGSLIEMFGIGILPVAIGIAILRHNLYDIDHLINRTLVYGLLSAALLATYFGLVLGLGTLVRESTGESSPVVVAASTLAVAALFRPLRARIQDVVDRRFYRSKYDAARTLEEFSARLGEEIDLESLSREVRDIVNDTMQPAYVSVWLRDRTARR